MRWTGWIAIGATVLALAGCGYGYRMASVQPRYSSSSRPDASYFCYDCHGYRYFDPYYDYCAGNGFRYHWAEHPGAMVVYRDRYVRIKKEHPDYGRYSYRTGYRSEAAYRAPRDYEQWRQGVKETPAADERTKRGVEEREKNGREPGTGKKQKGEQRKGSRDDGSRLTLPGGVS
jgi:hypothetical protein